MHIMAILTCSNDPAIGNNGSGHYFEGNKVGHSKESIAIVTKGRVSCCRVCMFWLKQTEGNGLRCA